MTFVVIDFRSSLILSAGGFLFTVLFKVEDMGTVTYFSNNRRLVEPINGGKAFHHSFNSPGIR